MAPPLVAVVGPTASGKSALALRLARERAGEIVSCDSLQVYRGLDIGSAKATAAERAAVPHHLLDVADPAEPFSAADYARLARAALDEIRARGRLAIVAGGSGLYLRALLQGLFEGPSRDDTLRRRLERMAARFGDARLHRLLSRSDPSAAARIHPGDRVRIVRALEVFRLSGRPISEQQAAGNRPLPGYRTLVVGLAPDRARLRAKVEARTRAMIESGLVDEARAVLEAARARGGAAVPRPLGAIGYRQAVAVIRGVASLEQAERSIVGDTMRLAKRQMTWFRHQQASVEWFANGEDAFRRVVSWLDEPVDPGGWQGGAGPDGGGGQEKSV